MSEKRAGMSIKRIIGKSTQKIKGVFFSKLLVFIFYIFLFIITTALSSCSAIKRDKFVEFEQGISAWRNEDYNGAVTYLEKYEYLKSKQLYEIIAISYLKLNQPELALKWFQKGKNISDSFSENMYFGLLSIEAKNKKYTENLSFLEFVEDIALKNNIDPGLLLAFMQQESSFKVDAISKTGAVGLMQLMPSTARALGLKVPKENDNYTPKITEPYLDERFNPAKNISAAAKHISFLIKNYQESKSKTDLTKVIAAYYAGTGVVQDSIPHYCEYYLSRISKNYKKYRYSTKNHAKAVIDFHKINAKNQEYFVRTSNFDYDNKSIETYLLDAKKELSKNLDKSQKAIFFNNLALIYEELDNNIQAENFYQLAILNEKNETFFYNYGLFLYENKRFEEAKIQFDKIIDSTKLEESANLLMSSHYLKSNELDKAFALIWDNQYLHYDAERYNHLGIYYYFKGDYDTALSMFSLSMKKKDSIIVANNFMATLYNKHYSAESRLDYAIFHKSSFIQKNDFIWPLENSKITSKFGWRPDPIERNWNDRLNSMNFHSGIDLVTCGQDTIYAVADGKVKTSQMFKNGGNTICIQHENGEYSSYMHLKKRFVKVDDTVHKGEKIGIVGNTGRSTAAHLHFGIHDKNWKSINPLKVLPQKD